MHIFLLGVRYAVWSIRVYCDVKKKIWWTVGSNSTKTACAHFRENNERFETTTVDFRWTIFRSGPTRRYIVPETRLITPAVVENNILSLSLCSDSGSGPDINSYFRSKFVLIQRNVYAQPRRDRTFLFFFIHSFLIQTSSKKLCVILDSNVLILQWGFFQFVHKHVGHGTGGELKNFCATPLRLCVRKSDADGAVKTRFPNLWSIRDHLWSTGPWHNGRTTDNNQINCNQWSDSFQKHNRVID